MNRALYAPALALIFSVATVTTAFQQPQQASGTAPAAAPAAKAKWIAPVKGIASIEVIQGTSRKVGNDVVTVLKVKNLSKAPIAGFRADEYWYDKSQQPKVVTGDTERWQKPFQPGEVIEMTMKSPWKPDLYTSRREFSHANGKIDAKGVKTFSK
jgi:hypothetical protein